jgi:hypothetical protein
MPSTSRCEPTVLADKLYTTRPLIQAMMARSLLRQRIFHIILRPYTNMYCFPDPKLVKESQLSSEIRLLAAASQGRELPGMPTTETTLHLFRKQAQSRHSIATFHVNLVTDFAQTFVEQLIHHVVGEDATPTASAIFRFCINPFFEKKRELMNNKLDEILRPYISGAAIPLETEFRFPSSKRDVARLAGRVAKALEHPIASMSGNLSPGLDRNTIIAAISAADDLHSPDFGTDNTIDMADMYYEVSYT